MTSFASCILKQHYATKYRVEREKQQRQKPLCWEKQQEGYPGNVGEIRWESSGNSVCRRKIMEGLIRYGKDFGFILSDGNQWNIFSRGVTSELYLTVSV